MITSQRVIGQYVCAICCRRVYETNELMIRLLFGPLENRRQICHECYGRLRGDSNLWLQLVREALK